MVSGSQHRVMRDSRLVIAALAMAAALAIAGGCASSPHPGAVDTTPRRVGVLIGIELFTSAVNGFEQHLDELAQANGVVIDYALGHASGDAAEMRRLAEDFVAQRVDLIFTVTNGAALAARAATRDTGIPVVFAIVLAPVRGGIIDDMQRPSGNVTGVHNALDIFIGKRLEFLSRVAPQVRRVWVPHDPSYSTIPIVLPELRRAAVLLGLELVETAVGSPREVEAWAARPQPIDAILVMPDAVVQHPRSWAAMLRLAHQQRIPIVANTSRQVDDGALLSYLSDNFETGREAALLADRVLRANTTVPLPVVSSEPRLIVNSRVLRTLGLELDGATAALVSEYRGR